MYPLEQAEPELKLLTYLISYLADPVCGLLQKAERRYTDSFKAEINPNDAFDLNRRMWQRELCRRVVGDPNMNPEELARIREQEQSAAAKLLGVMEVVFLRHPD